VQTYSDTDIENERESRFWLCEYCGHEPGCYCRCPVLTRHEGWGEPVPHAL